MDYRSPFELRQQILEEVRVTHTPSPSRRSRSKGRVDPCLRGDANGGQQPNLDTDASRDLSQFMLSIGLPDDPTALVREVPGAENLAALKAALAREEAVQRYMEKEQLSLEDSARYIMANGSAGQRLSFFAHARANLLDLPPKRVVKVLDILLDSMWTQDPELQCRAPVDILDFLGLLDAAGAAEVYEVVKTMLTVQTAEIRISWGQLLLGLVDYLPLETLEGDLISLAVSKSEHAQASDQRELSCQLLGRVCAQLPVAKAEQLVLPRAMALCQDTNVGVRRSMCQQLCAIAHALGVEKAKTLVAPDLFELLSDEEQAVSRAAFSCLIDLVEFFGATYRREKLFPIIKAYISNPPSEVVGLLIGEFGRFLDAIKTDITAEEDVVLFAEFFCNAATRSGAEARRQCAFNFPAVVASLPRTVFTSHLSRALLALAVDNTVGARRSIAAGMHALLPLLPPSAVDAVETPFLCLIRDADPGVRAELVQHMSELLDYFRKCKGEPARRGFFSAVLDAILGWVSEPPVNWRVLQHVVDIIERYLPTFEEKALLDRVLLLLWTHTKLGAVAVKASCAHLLMHIASRVTAPSVQAQIFSRLNGELGRSSSCYTRQAYFYFVAAGFDYFSTRCVRERMLECCLELQRDGVATVRLALANALPLLSQSLRTATPPGALEEEFAAMVARLGNDSDSQVRAAVQVYLSSRSTRSRGTNAAPQSRKIAPDATTEDHRRESAELAMLDIAKETDKAERRAKLRNLLKGEREKECIDLPYPIKARKQTSVGVGGGAVSPSAHRRPTAKTTAPVTLPRLTPVRHTPSSTAPPSKVSLNRRRL